MELNENQFHKNRWMPESMAALQRLAEMPTYTDVSGFSPDHTTPLAEHEYHLEKAQKHYAEHIKPWEEHTMALMEKERIPQLPKLRQQYDRGSITGPEYASQLLLTFHTA